MRDGGPMELTEEVVDEFVENVPMSVRLAKFRTKSSKRGPYRDWETDRKSTRLNSSHSGESRMPSSA